MSSKFLYQIKRGIPNAITSMNILSGCISIVFAFEGNLIWSVYMIAFSAIFDFFDGMTARLLNAYTDIGKELDSLADIVSFGLAPSVIMYQLLKLALGTEGLLFNLEYYHFLEMLILFSPFFIAVFSALRLAKFNLDTRQTESFIGMPTPALALFIASLPLILFKSDIPFLSDIILNIYFLLFVIFGGSYLLVAELPMFSFKFKNINPKKNIIRLVFIAIAILLLIILKFIAIPILVFVYVLFSIFNNIFVKKKH